MKMLLVLQEIASQRGDGLRPELVRLLDRTGTLAQMDHGVLASARTKQNLITHFPQSRNTW
jgi:hypothetical protein